MVPAQVPGQTCFGSLNAVRAGTIGTSSVVPASFGTSINKNFPVLGPKLIGNLKEIKIIGTGTSPRL